MIVKEVFDKAIKELKKQQAEHREFQDIEVSICIDEEKDLGFIIMLYDFMCDGCKGVEGCNHKQYDECDGGYCNYCRDENTCKCKSEIEHYDGKCIWQIKTMKENAFIVCFEVLVVKNFSKSVSRDNALEKHYSENFNYITEEYTELYDLLKEIK